MLFKPSSLLVKFCLTTFVLFLTAGSVHATSVQDYLIITTDSRTTPAVNLQDVELGAIGPNLQLNGGSVTEPQGTSIPGNARGPQIGITNDGDVAITNSGSTFQASNVQIYSSATGPNNRGRQGVDCAGSNCSPSGSNNEYSISNEAGLSSLANNNGFQGNIDHSGLISELGSLGNDISALSTTRSDINLSSGTVGNFTVDLLTAGLHVIDIDTNDNDFSLNNGNWIVNGVANSSVIFRVESGANLKSSNGNFLLQGGIGVHNVLFLIEGDGTSIDFSNTNFFGYSFWDLSRGNNRANLSQSRGCGQIINDDVVFNNVSLSGCSFDVAAVPIPAAAWLFGSGLIGLVGIARRRRMQAAKA